MSVVLVSMLVAASLPARAQYQAIDLTPPGFLMADCLAVSDTQQGGIGVDSAPGSPASAMLWSGTAGSFVNIHPSSYQWSQIYGMSDTQQVGQGEDASYQYHALLWSGTAASVVDLNPSSMTSSLAQAVWGGQQVGYASSPATSYSHAFLWTGTAASAVDLHPSAYWSSVAYGTSGTQQVGLGAIGSDGHALLWSGTAASVVDLNPSGWRYTRANGISGNTQSGYGTPDGGYEHALIWHGTAASVVDLNPSGYCRSYIWGAGGEYQAGSANPTDESGTAYQDHAAVWHGSAESFVDLHAFLPPGFQASVAWGVNANGDAGGYAIDNDGYQHAILWKHVLANVHVAAGTPVSGRIGQTVTLTATLTRTDGGAAVSGETLHFSVDGTPVGSGTTGVDGHATCSWAIAEGAVGARSISVDHQATALFGAAAGSGTLNVTKGIPAFSLYAAAGPVGATVNLKTLFLCGGTGIVGRTVQFAVDGTPVGNATSGATCATLSWKIPAGTAAGTHNVTASFAGDGCYVAASRTSAALTVKANVAFSLFPAGGAPGAKVTLKTLMVSGGVELAGKTVQFAVDGTPVGSTVSGLSCASLDYTIPLAMTAGLHNVTAIFAGDGAYNPASRTTAALTVTVPKLNVAFSLYASSGSIGQTVTLKSMMISGGAAVIGRTVQFSVDGGVVGTGVSDASGVACTYTIPPATATGLHTVTVTFASDSIYNGATRTTAALTVKP